MFCQRFCATCCTGPLMEPFSTSLSAACWIAAMSTGWPAIVAWLPAGVWMVTVPQAGVPAGCRRRGRSCRWSSLRRSGRCRYRPGWRHHVDGIGGEVDEVRAELVVDQPEDDLFGSGHHRLRDDHGVGTDGLDGVRVEHLGHADAPHRALVDEALAGGEAIAEREHHDPGEADADDEHPGVV